jgi:hypothetical protein
MIAQRAIPLAVALSLIACDAPTDTHADPAFASVGGPAASASGGGHWFLTLPPEFGLPPIEQVLGFTARKYADGSVDGQIEYHQNFLDFQLRFKATVTCMNVYDGNRVKYGGLITSSNDPDFPAGGYMWFQEIDNGEGGDVPPDQSTGSGFGDEAANEAFCNSPNPPNPTFLSEIDGDIQVRD